MIRSKTTIVARRLRAQRCASALAFVLLAFLQAPVFSASINSGHSAMWFDPNRSGEGWVLEILPEDRALLYWFTYDDIGQQRWIQGIGEIIRGGDTGDSIFFAEIYQTRGPSFARAGPESDVEIEVVGSASIAFLDCNRGVFTFDALGQSGSTDIRRLSETMAVGCQPRHGRIGKPVQGYAGQSGSWFDPTIPGQGLSLQWMSRNQAIVTWYTYDSEGSPYWLVGNGAYSDGTIVFESLNATRGARFGQAFDPNDVELINWGSLELTLGCNEGTARFSSLLPEFGEGEMNLIRLTAIDRLACPWQAKPLQELYDIQLTEVPLRSPGTSPETFAWTMADDGSVAAWDMSNGSIWLWQPDAAEMVELTHAQRLTGPVLNARGNAVFANGRDPASGSQIPMRWTPSQGWQPLSGLDYSRALITGVSKNGKQVVGRASSSGRNEIWRWSEDGSVSTYASELDGAALTPTAVSNDGLTLYGFVNLPPGNLGEFEPVGAVRWREGDSPELLVDKEDAPIIGVFPACDESCRVVAGVGLPGDQSGAEDQIGVWLSFDGGAASYLPRPGNELEPFVVPSVETVSSDGTMLGGMYSQMPLPSSMGTAFLWTQNTGYVSVADLIEPFNLPSGDNMFLEVKAISGSADRLLLSLGYKLSPSTREVRGYILSLNPPRN